jgi:hypothetical protein
MCAADAYWERMCLLSITLVHACTRVCIHSHCHTVQAPCVDMYSWMCALLHCTSCRVTVVEIACACNNIITHIPVSKHLLCRLAMAHEAITEGLAPQQQDTAPLQRLKGFSWIGRHVAGLPYLRYDHTCKFIFPLQACFVRIFSNTSLPLTHSSIRNLLWERNLNLKWL